MIVQISKKLKIVKRKKMVNRQFKKCDFLISDIYKYMSYEMKQIYCIIIIIIIIIIILLHCII